MRSVWVTHLLTEPLLTRPDCPDSLQQFVELVGLRPRTLQSLVIEREPSSFVRYSFKMVVAHCWNIIACDVATR